MGFAIRSRLHSIIHFLADSWPHGTLNTALFAVVLFAVLHKDVPFIQSLLRPPRE